MNESPRESEASGQLPGMLFLLQPQEQVLDEAGKGDLKTLVTTHRLIASSSEFFGLIKDEKYIPVEKIDSIQRKSVFPKELFGLAAVLGALGLLLGFLWGIMGSILGFIVYDIWDSIMHFVLRDLLGWMPGVGVLEWMLLLPGKLLSYFIYPPGFLNALISTGFGVALIAAAIVCLIAAWFMGRQMVMFESGGGEAIGISAKGDRVEAFVQAVESAIRARAG